MGPQQAGQPPHGAFIMHPYYGLVPQPYPQPYGVFAGPPAPGEAASWPQGSFLSALQLRCRLSCADVRQTAAQLPTRRAVCRPARLPEALCCRPCSGGTCRL